MLSSCHPHAIWSFGDAASLSCGHTGLRYRMLIRMTIPRKCCYLRMKLHGVINQNTTIDIVVITITTINITTLGLLRLQRLTIFPLFLEVSLYLRLNWDSSFCLYCFHIFSFEVFQPYILYMYGQEYDFFQTVFNIILFNDQLDAQFFFVYIYFNSLHVSSIQVLIIRRFNCINTMSGICHSM